MCKSVLNVYNFEFFSLPFHVTYAWGNGWGGTYEEFPGFILRQLAILNNLFHLFLLIYFTFCSVIVCPTYLTPSILIHANL